MRIDPQAGARAIGSEAKAPYLRGSADLAVVRRSATGDRGATGDRRAWRRRGCRLMIDGLRVDLGRFLGLVVLRKPLLERLDALGEVAHQLGNLAAPAE